MSFIDDAVREYIWNVGRDQRDQQWILSHYDTWHKNPFYIGPPQRHPEDNYYSDDE